MMILIYIASLKHILCQIFKEMDKIRIIKISQTPSTILFDAKPPSPHIHQKMRKGCRNNYIEAFGALYWRKKKLFK